MTAHAVAIRRDDNTLALFLRVMRAPSGIYVVFAAGQERKGHDPHSSWHRDGRVHHKSFGRMALPFARRQPLASIRDVEPFVQTGVSQGDAHGLPDCDPSRFDTVVEVPDALLNTAPRTTTVEVALAPPASPVAVAYARLLRQSVITDAAPNIVVSVVEYGF